MHILCIPLQENHANVIKPYAIFITRWQECGKMCRLFIISGNCRCRDRDMELAV